MKYSIIEISTIFLVLGAVRTDECNPIPQIIIDNVVACADNVTTESLRIVFSENPGTSDPECYAYCVYSKSGYFQNNQFSKEFIDAFLRKNVFHSSIDKLVELSIELAENANAVGGDNCKKAFEFFIMNNATELQQLQMKIFCPPEMPNSFRERVEGFTENHVYFPKINEN